MVSMNENGDAEGNYTVIARKKRTSDASYGLYPVAMFLMPSNSSDIPVGFHSYIPNKSLSCAPPPQDLYLSQDIDWIQSRAPVDEPACGFDGEKCEGNLIS